MIPLSTTFFCCHVLHMCQIRESEIISCNDVISMYEYFGFSSYTENKSFRFSWNSEELQNISESNDVLECSSWNINVGQTTADENKTSSFFIILLIIF